MPGAAINNNPIATSAKPLSMRQIVSRTTLLDSIWSFLKQPPYK